MSHLQTEVREICFIHSEYETHGKVQEAKQEIYPYQAPPPNFNEPLERLFDVAPENWST